MRIKAAFLIGGLVGYVLGARGGREQYETLKAKVTGAWEDPRVQEKVSDVERRAADLVKEKAPEVKDKVGGAVRQAADKVRGGEDRQDPAVHI